jgi:phosphatidylserine/phosphatidylglycerophosphate/cardiolipin synthase-like enzyme
MSAALVDRCDAWLGERLERLVSEHHRRRLRRVGRIEQLDPADAGAWAAGPPSPRADCDIEVLIDGAEILPRIADAIIGAKSYVHVAGWHVEPDFGLTRDAEAETIRTLLATASDSVAVRVLLWAGAPVPVFSPRRRQMREVRARLTDGTRIDCELDGHERPMHCHHEKLIVVDGDVAFVGGLDLTWLAGDRYDTRDHPVRGGLGWHDVGVRLRGPAVADVDAHFRMRWGAVTGTALEPAPVPAKRSGGATVQVVRTVPENVYDAFPKGDFSILESYTRALRKAESLVYLENQFLWSPELVAILESKLADPPRDDFRVLALLPQHPNNGSDDTRGQVGRLIRADGGAGRFLATTIRQRSGSVTGPLYVHAKVGIVDDNWLTIGSANLNEHSMFNDSELNVVSCDPELARTTRLRLWAEHLERTVDDVDGPPSRVIDELWRPIAVEQRRRLDAGLPATHRLLELQGASRRSMALLGPLQGFLVDA